MVQYSEVFMVEISLALVSIGLNMNTLPIIDWSSTPCMHFIVTMDMIVGIIH